MNRKEFDKILGDKLRYSESSVNPKIWDNIANALETEKKLGFLPWFSANMVILFFLTGLGAAGAFYYRNEIKQLVTNHRTVALANQNPVKITATKDLDQVTNNNNTNSESIVLSSSSIDNQSDKNTEIENDLNTSYKGNNKIYNKPNSKNKLRAGNTSLKNILGSLNQMSPAMDKEKAIKINASALDISKNESVDGFTKESTLDKLPISIFTNFDIIENNPIFINKNGPKKRPKCPRFYSTAPRYSFTFYGGPSLLTKKLNVDNKEFAALKPAREQTESALVGSTFGFYADVTFRNKFLLRTGLNYFIAREKFRFVQEDDQILKSKVIVSDTIQGTDGKTYLQLDTLFYLESGTRVRQSVNSFRVIEMPLLAGIQFDHGRWYGSVIGGLLLQLYQFNEGLILDKNTLEPVAFSSRSQNEQYFRQSWGLGVYASLQLGYRLTDAYSVIFEPNIRYYPGNTLVDGNPLVQTNTILGSNLGIRYSF